jgi:hypothetical protein
MRFPSAAALESLAFGTAIPTLDGKDVFYSAGIDKRFTIYVLMTQAKTALEAAIASGSNGWHEPLYVGDGKFKGVAVKR